MRSGRTRARAPVAVPPLNALVSVSADGTPVPGRVEDVDEGLIAVSVSGDTRSWSKGADLHLEWVDDGLWSRDGRVVSRNERGWLWLTPTTQPVREQRRGAYRVETNASVVVEGGARGRVTGRTLDVSATGCRLLLPADATPGRGDPLQVVLHLEDEELRLQGRVVRRETGPGGAALGVAFTDVDTPTAQRLGGVLQAMQVRALRLRRHRS